MSESFEDYHVLGCDAMKCDRYVPTLCRKIPSPTVCRAKYQKGTGYMGVKVFNRLPINIKKEIDNPKKFRHILKNFLKEKSFYSLQEYFELENYIKQTRLNYADEL